MTSKIKTKNGLYNELKIPFLENFDIKIWSHTNSLPGFSSFFTTLAIYYSYSINFIYLGPKIILLLLIYSFLFLFKVEVLFKHKYWL